MIQYDLLIPLSTFPSRRAVGNPITEAENGDCSLAFMTGCLREKWSLKHPQKGYYVNCQVESYLLLNANLKHPETVLGRLPGIKDPTPKI